MTNFCGHFDPFKIEAGRYLETSVTNYPVMGFISQKDEDLKTQLPYKQVFQITAFSISRYCNNKIR